MTIRQERLRLIGMRCVGCETVIEDALQALDGVRSAKANHLGPPWISASMMAWPASVKYSRSSRTRAMA